MLIPQSIRGIVQFTMCITSRCILRRIPNQPINRCMCEVCLQKLGHYAIKSYYWNYNNNTWSYSSCGPTIVNGQEYRLRSCFTRKGDGNDRDQTSPYNSYSYLFRSSIRVHMKSSFIFIMHSHVFATRMILPQVHLRKPCYDFSFL